MPQKVGDVCENCKEYWERKKKEPMILVSAAQSTQNKKMIVPLCPHCDGAAVEVVALGNHEDPLEPA